MRFLVIALFGLASFASAQPNLAKPPKNAVHQCKSRCSVQYEFCKKRATTKNARKGCSANRKFCKGHCGG